MTQCSNLPLASSGAEQWEQWHKNLIKCVGRGKANDLFLRLWDKRGQRGTDANTIQLRQYLGTQGLVMTTGAIKKTQDFFCGSWRFFWRRIKCFRNGNEDFMVRISRGISNRGIWVNIFNNCKTRNSGKNSGSRSNKRKK